MSSYAERERVRVREMEMAKARRRRAEAGAQQQQPSQEPEEPAFNRFSQGAVASTAAFGDMVASAAGVPVPEQATSLRQAEELGLTQPGAMQRGDLASVAGRGLPYLAGGVARGTGAVVPELLSYMGATAGEFAGHQMAGEEGGAIGGLAGALSPVALNAGAKRMLGTQAGARENVALREGTGAPVGFGEVGGSDFIKQTERISSRMIGGRGAANRRANKIGLAIYRRADDLSTKLNPQRLSLEGVGQEIKEGFEAGRLRFKDATDAAYDDLRIGIHNTTVRPNSLNRVLAQLQKEVLGSGEMAQALDKPTGRYVQGLLKGFAKDLERTGGQFSLEDYQRLRRSLGPILESRDMAVIGSRRQQIAERIWGATQQDMSLMAAVADQNTRRVGGNPTAVKSLNKANSMYSEGMKRMKLVTQQVLAKDIPSKIAEAAYASKDSPEIMRALRDSMPKRQFDEAAGLFIEQMGKVQSGRTTAISIDDELAGVEFGMEQFLTNLSNIRRGRTMDILFPGRMGDDLTQIAKVMRGAREVIQTSPNMSGTAQAAGDLELARGAAVATVAGYAGEFIKGFAGLVGAGKAGQWISSSPMFINWVARSTVMPVAQLPQHLEKLFSVVEKEPHTVGMAKSIVEQLKGSVAGP